MASAFDDNDLQRFRRLLNYYTEGSVYKVIGRTYSKDHVECLIHMLEEKRGKEILAEVEKCIENCTPCQKEMLLYTVALCMKSKDNEVKQHANKTFLLLCKSARELFMFLEFHKKLSRDLSSKGFGRSLKCTLNEWYNRQDPMELAVLTMNESSYGGWSHRDVIRLAHLKGKSEGTSIIFKYLVKGLDEVKNVEIHHDNVQKVVDYLTTIHTVRHSSDEHQVARLIEKFNLVKSHVPTSLLGSKEVWNALISEMSVAEILQNLNKLAMIGFLEESYENNKKVIEILRSEEDLQKSSIQPMQVLIAMSLYENGKGGKMTWTRNDVVRDALNLL